mmetsp:Transcript_16631/g.25030  ORF Transcript_16631/g.25030 Transcript_16631/m.25030 type:complete len:373 (-) Transcript_16631:164-1282(-)
MEIKVGEVIIDVEDIIHIAEKASEGVMGVYRGLSEQWNDMFLEEDTPLIQAQEVSHRILTSELSSRFPDIPVISKNSKMEGYADRVSYQHFFCVNPLDGYKEFVRRSGQFSINIGLCEGHTPVLGVVYVPCGHSGNSAPAVYYAVDGLGAYTREVSLCHAEGGADNKPRLLIPKRLEAQSFYEHDSGLRIITPSTSYFTDATHAFVSAFTDPVLLGDGGNSLLNMLRVASGDADVYPKLAPTCEWNTCALHAIVNEAGGEILQIGGGADAVPGMQLEYNKPHPLNPYLVTYGKRLVRMPPSLPGIAGQENVSESESESDEGSSSDSEVLEEVKNDNGEKIVSHYFIGLLVVTIVSLAVLYFVLIEGNLPILR